MYVGNVVGEAITAIEIASRGVNDRVGQIFSLTAQDRSLTYMCNE